jgi:hypothetical protein
MQQIVDVIDPVAPAAIDLRDSLADLIWKGRHEEQDGYQFQGHFDHLAGALIALCEKQLEAMGSMPRPEACLVWACVVASRFGADEAGTRSAIQSLKSQFKEGGNWREAAFWVELNLISEVAQTESSSSRYFQVLNGSLLGQPVAGDRSWLLEALQNSKDHQCRLTSLQALMWLWSSEDRNNCQLEEIAAAVRGNDVLTEVLRQLSRPIEVSPEQEERRRIDSQEKLEHEERESQRLEKWLLWKKQLIADPDAAFTEEELSNTVWNLFQWLEALNRDGQTSFSAWNEKALREVFSEDIAAKAAKAFRAVWREHPAILKSQRSPGDRESISWVCCEGLTGLEAESSTSGWALCLTVDEARIAAAYATIELNGFPVWLRDLTAAHSRAVEEVIGNELSLELANDGGCSCLATLQNLSRADIGLKRLLAPRLLDWLPNWPSKFRDDNCAQQSAHHLRQVLSILNEVIVSRAQEEIAELCRRQLSDNPDGSLVLTWLRGLFQFDSESATLALEGRLESFPERERAARAVELFSNLFGSRGASLVFLDDGRRAATLDRLVRSAYHYVRPEEDRKSESQVSDIRTDAERARDFLLMTLLDTSGVDAQKFIVNLAKDAIFAHYPDRLLLLARKRAARDAEGPALTAEEIVTLEKRLEMPPHDLDSLFNCMIDRLEDLAHDLAHHDFTNRRTLKTVDDEIEMQRNLAGSLLVAAKDAYKVSREEEVADCKRTDIRLEARRGSHKAVIEVKIADRWSLRELEQALRVQVVGQYLRHSTCKAGCLLLTYHGRKNYWRDRGRRLSFIEITEHLKSLARSIEELEMHKLRLTVFPLDLTDPQIPQR